MKIKIGSRGSKLALWQSEYISAEIRKHNPGVEVEIIKIKTKGDKILDAPLSKVGGKGLFVKEIEEAVLSGDAHLAVHSMKDMPTEIPEGLAIVSTPVREDPRDALVTNKGNSLKALPKGAGIGTSSLRRKSQIMNLRPDFQFADLRGNVDTRLKKLDEGQYDAIILAGAGLKRLGWAMRISCYLDYDECLPAVGQGIIAIEARVDDKDTCRLLEPLNHKETHIAAFAERAFLARLEGGCQVPIAAHAEISEAGIKLEGLVASLDGKTIIRSSKEGSVNDAGQIGKELAEEILRSGGNEILKEVYGDDWKGGAF